MPKPQQHTPKSLDAAQDSRGGSREAARQGSQTAERRQRNAPCSPGRIRALTQGHGRTGGERDLWHESELLPAGKRDPGPAGSSSAPQRSNESENARSKSTTEQLTAYSQPPARHRPQRAGEGRAGPTEGSQPVRSGPARPAPCAAPAARPAGPGPAHLSLLAQAPPPPGRAACPQPETQGEREGRRGGKRERGGERKKEERGRIAQRSNPHTSPLRRDRGSQPRWRPGEAGPSERCRRLPEGAAPHPGRLRHACVTDFRFRLPPPWRPRGLLSGRLPPPREQRLPGARGAGWPEAAACSLPRSPLPCRGAPPSVPRSPTLCRGTPRPCRGAPLRAAEPPPCRGTPSVPRNPLRAAEPPPCRGTPSVPRNPLRAAEPPSLPLPSCFPPLSDCCCKAFAVGEAGSELRDGDGQAGEPSERHVCERWRCHGSKRAWR
ncbi:basic salivary proline-rich protein 4-like [Melanerpes formicivorus]|uniref:basic salivary proline-rich protein 4-like n=1 Tax=Melanerpes formicivorus TaxID=211600 RepID=UPI00358E68DD